MFRKYRKPFFNTDGAGGAASSAEETVEQQSQVDNAQQTSDPQAGTEAPKTSRNAERSSEDYEREIKELRRENEKRRHAAKELDDLKAKLEAEKLTKEEQQAKRIAELERTHNDMQRTHQERTVRYEVQLQAAKLGIVDPDAAVRLLDWADLEFEDDGTPKNAEDLLKKLIKARPWLAQQQQVSDQQPQGQQTQRATPNPGATNPTKTTAGNSGPIPITADQYIDRRFQDEFKRANGMTVLQAVTTGKAKIIS